MLRKILRLLILLALIGALVLGIYYFTSTRNQPTIPGEQKKSFSFKDFLPFGTKKTTTTEDTNGSIEIPTDLAAPVVEAPKKMYRLSNRKVVAIVPYQRERMIDIPVATSTTKTKMPQPTKEITYDYGVRFLEKTSGLIYEMMNAVPGVEKRISDSVTPTLGEGMIGNDGNSLISRFLRPEDDATIDTFVGNVIGMSTPAKIIGSFLPRNVVSISVSPDGSKYFYLYPINGGATGVVSNFVGGNKATIFTSPFTEWATSWTNQQFITVYPKPSGLVKNYVYRVDASTGEMKKLVGGLPGLSAIMSPDGTMVAYSHAKNNSMALTIYSPDQMKGKETGLQTLSDKCVFSPDGRYLYCAVPNTVSGATYPDTWYKGEVSFEDSFWKLDVANQAYYLIVDTTETGDSVDATNLQISKDGSLLYFINKKDDTPWVVETR
ncbi:MAG: hypothetical protein WCO58_01910 [bacterium]